MKLTDCEVERLIPLFMRKQPDIVALCRELDPVIRDIGNKLKLLSFWGSLGDQPEEALDRKATDLDISWYRKGAALDKKREMIRSADQVHMKLGTKWAVDFVLSMYYDNAVSEEWFQYDGDPGHFRVIVRDTDFDPDLPMEMLDLLNEVKRAGAILDYVEHEWEEYLTQHIGAAHGAGREDIRRSGPCTGAVRDAAPDGRSGALADRTDHTGRHGPVTGGLRGGTAPCPGGKGKWLIRHTTGSYSPTQGPRS